VRAQKHEWLSGLLESHEKYRFLPEGGGLVGALGKQSHQNHQIRKGKEPLICPNASRFGGAGDETEVTGLGEIVYVLDADPRQARNL